LSEDGVKGTSEFLLCLTIEEQLPRLLDQRGGNLAQERMGRLQAHLEQRPS
jgi:hypothetical protein